MNARIQHLLNHPFEVQLSDVAILQDEIDQYPYFSMLRTLLLFGLKEHDHPSYQEELKKTSIYSPSRVALYHYLQKERQENSQLEENISEEVEEIHVAENNSSSDETVIFLDDSNSVEWIEETDQDEVEISSNTQEETSENITQKALSFNEWLKVANQKKSDFAVEKPQPTSPSERDLKFQLIDEFIEKAPKITPVKHLDAQPKSIKNETSNEYSDLMTETLAQIYTQQKKYDKAIRAYKILSIKYPEKYDFFQEKIDEIEYLKEHKQN